MALYRDPTFTIKTLQRGFVVYMLLPAVLLLGGMGTIGFLYARGTLFRQWEEAAILKLQRDSTSLCQ